MVAYREYQPSAALAPYIDCYWMHQRTDVSEFSEHLIVPDGTVELIISPVAIERQYQANGPFHTLKSHIAGLKTQPQRVRLKHPYTLYGIRIKPSGLAMFTAVPVAQTIDSALQPEMLFGPRFNTLEQRLFNAPDDATRVLLMEQFLLARLPESERKHDVVLSVALDAMRQSGGNARLDSIAQKLRVSCKTVERRFINTLGIPPKRYFRLYRFVNALKGYHDHRPEKLSDIAYEHGYFDQMHFVREVRAFTGCAPREYFKSWADPQHSIQAAMFQHDEGVQQQPQHHKADLLRAIFG